MVGEDRWIGWSDSDVFSGILVVTPQGAFLGWGRWEWVTEQLQPRGLPFFCLAHSGK